MGIMFSVKSSILAALNWPLPNVNAKLAPVSRRRCCGTGQAFKLYSYTQSGHDSETWPGKSEEIPIASAISSRTSEDFSPKDTTRIRAGRLPGDLDELPSGSPCQSFGVRLPKEVPHH